MKLGFRIALRYVMAGGSQTYLMMALVMIGVTAYTFITATVTGVQKSVIDQTLGSSSHVTVEPYDRLPLVLDSSKEVLPVIIRGQQRDKKISDWKSVMKRIEGLAGITSLSPTVTGSGFAIKGTQSRPISLKGGYTDQLDGIVDVKTSIIQGEFKLDSGRCVIGITLAKKLSLSLGEKVRLQSEKGIIATYQIAGLISKGNPNFDESTVWLDLHDAQRMMELPGAITAIETKLSDIWVADAVARRLSDRTGLDCKPWTRENGQIMTLITSQNLATGVIRAFALLSVAVGIASVLNVTVSQKSKEIGIVKSMGAKANQITATFVILGGLIGFVGGILGAVLTYISTSAIVGATKDLPKGGPTVSMDFRPEYIWQAILVAITVAVVGAIIPARKASRLDPVEAIRV